ncbi:hypothetical protein SAPIO_CDS7317 [Scedosporium apiospermum]|uniref:Myb-like domain-containing protein n=1 Tax=Pseudallescheria apiosperma TaxID=563466 RepID=A0A084G1L7_PSEDA|nr:uncharacterized protein SAPIO_CDS7317 [Scedosporium apiospermum]KEZ41229.1 hypothetical protein SAPIO_CDS7317 [Scedosporium apiospermum]
MSSQSWTETERANLCMQVLDQWRPTKGHVDWDKVEIKGRTKKACQQAWHKFWSDMRAKQGEDDGGSPTPKVSPRKRAARKLKVKDEEQGSSSEDNSPSKKRVRIKVEKIEDTDDEVPKTPVKKRRGRPKGSANKKRVKTEIVDDEIDVPGSIEEVNAAAASSIGDNA